MSANLLRISTAAGALLFALVLAPASFGQAGLFELRADVPFEFHIGGKVMPAGNYRISPTNNNSVVIAAMEPDGPRAAALTNLSGGGNAHDRSELVFTRYGDKYFLRQIWRAGLSNGRELPPARTEREIMFRAAASPERVYVAARDTR